MAGGRRTHPRPAAAGRCRGRARVQPWARRPARHRPGRAHPCRRAGARGDAPMTMGVLVMAYGTPRDRDDIATYYTDIRRGRPPSPELLADLVRRYDAVLRPADGA